MVSDLGSMVIILLLANCTLHHDTYQASNYLFQLLIPHHLMYICLMCTPIT